MCMGLESDSHGKPLVASADNRTLEEKSLGNLRRLAAATFLITVMVSPAYAICSMLKCAAGECTEVVLADSACQVNGWAIAARMIYEYTDNFQKTINCKKSGLGSNTLLITRYAPEQKKIDLRGTGRVQPTTSGGEGRGVALKNAKLLIRNNKIDLQSELTNYSSHADWIGMFSLSITVGEKMYAFPLFTVSQQNAGWKTFNKNNIPITIPEGFWESLPNDKLPEIRMNVAAFRQC